MLIAYRCSGCRTFEQASVDRYECPQRSSLMFRASTRASFETAAGNTSSHAHGHPWPLNFTDAAPKSISLPVINMEVSSSVQVSAFSYCQRRTKPANSEMPSDSVMHHTYVVWVVGHCNSGAAF